MSANDSVFDITSGNKDDPSVKSSSPENPEDKISKQVETASRSDSVVYEILYDRSGSMIQMPTAPEAIQNFISQQKEFCKTNKITSRFTLTVFDTVAEKVPKFDDVELRETGVIPPDWLRPRGYTRLVDTALERIVELRKKTKLEEKMPQDDKPVWQGIFVILTDGEDNQSKYSSSRLKGNNKANK